MFQTMATFVPMQNLPFNEAYLSHVKLELHP